MRAQELRPDKTLTGISTDPETTESPLREAPIGTRAKREMPKEHRRARIERPLWETWEKPSKNQLGTSRHTCATKACILPTCTCYCQIHWCTIQDTYKIHVALASSLLCYHTLVLGCLLGFSLYSEEARALFWVNYLSLPLSPSLFLSLSHIQTHIYTHNLLRTSK